MASEHVTLGEEVSDDALRDVVGAVTSGRVTPEQGWVNSQGRRAAKPRPRFMALATLFGFAMCVVRWMSHGSLVWIVGVHVLADVILIGGIYGLLS